MIKPLLSVALIVLNLSVYAQSDTPENKLLAEAYQLQQASKRDSAITYFSLAGEQFKKLDNWQKYIECLAGQNRNYLKTDQIANVAENGLAAIEMIDAGKADENDEHVLEILTQLSRYNWYAKGNFPESIKYLDRAIKICDKLDFDVTANKIQIFTEYGYTYGYSGDFDNSEKYFKQALGLALEVYGPDSEKVADRYTDMVFPLIQKSEWEKAEVALKKATELNIKLRGPEHISVMKNYNNLGYIYLEKFDNDQAILYINRAIDMIRERFGENHRSIGIGYMNLGASYHNKNEYRNCITYSLKAYENFKVSIGEKNPYMGIVLLNTANAYTYLNIADSAIYYYDKALKLKQELYGEQHHEIVNTYGYMSYFFITNGMYEEAFSVINKAIKISDKILPVKHKLSANNHLYMSQYYDAIGKYDQSLQEIQQALIGLVVDFDDTNIKTNPVLRDNIISTRILIDALVHKTKVLKTLALENDDIELLEIASKTALVTSQAIDLLRIEYQTPEAKELLISRSKEFYEDAIDIALLLYNKTASEEYLNLAFQHIEKSKSILLIENVRSRSEATISGLPDSIANEEKSLSRSISMVKEQMFEAQNQGDSSNFAKLEEQFFQKKRDHDLLLNYIEQNYPDYFSVQHAIFNTSIEAVQNSLKEQEMMISYFYGKNNLYTISISKIGLNYNVVAIEDTLQSALTMLVESFEKRKFDPGISHQIFERILQPILQNQNLMHSLVLLPDGILHYLPFEAFVTSSEPGKRNRYLIQDYTVYYMHSTSLPQISDNTSIESDLAYIGFSPSYNIESNPLLASRSARDVKIASQLEKLPMAEKEIETSASILSGKYLVNKDATEENFKQIAKDANIIHIASHTIIDDEEPLNSKLVFSPGADTVEDGLLHTYELYNMKLNAQLACLSACNTGFGKIKSGEGVVSLAKGFFYAGVPNVMMSLWSVPDISTSEIMTTFYKELKKGIGKADALRNAKLNYLELSDQNTSDPYYWAAFTMIGDNQAIEIDKPFKSWIWMIVFFSIAAITYLVIRRRQP
jgi:CHAT domain-containing protein/Tfp pilus assembly protein PilF